jgi:uncharacterized membrane protein
MASAHPPTRLEHLVHISLLAGLTISGALLLGGLVLTFVNKLDRPEGTPPPLHELLPAVMHGNGVALTNAGLLLLIMTPIVRVFVLAVGWGIAGNYRFMAVAIVVLLLLGISFLLGVG